MAAPGLTQLVTAGATATPQAAEHTPRGGRRWWLWLAALPVLGLLALVALVLVLLAGTVAQDCAGDGLPGAFSGPGSLGGVAGTGVSRSQVRALRAHSPHAGSALPSGPYVATAYGPPWGGINGPGASTSGGLAIRGGAPRWYMVAVDPALIGHGQLVFLWPNPFNWRGPFVAADTGGAIQGRRIDFYDWRGRRTQLAWGSKTVQASRTPLAPGTETAGLIPPAGDCVAPASGPLGTRIGRLARAQLGRGPSIPGFRPPAVGYAWCAWFATNIWRKAGVPIPVNAWSGYPYDWAAARGQLFKHVGRPPRGATPPAGSALMYGTNSRSSGHINLVDRVLADGSFMVTGGNQDGSRVTRYGPCRLQRADPALITGPGCDPRPIYGIATPTGADT